MLDIKDKFLSEKELVTEMLDKSKFLGEKSINNNASEIIQLCRKNKSDRTMLDAFLNEYGLDNQEGVALMCLAESVLRIPDKKTRDLIISEKQLRYALGNKKREAVVIRTLPNTKEKLCRQYSNTNPPFLSEAAAIYLRNKGVKHLLIDLPSIDKENDSGDLKAHKAFWDFNGSIRFEATITELIYVPNSVEDGKYILNLLIAPFQNDASPSKPVLYKLYD